MATEVINNCSNVTARNLTHFPHSNFYLIAKETRELKQIYELLENMTKTCLNIVAVKMKVSVGD